MPEALEFILRGTDGLSPTIDKAAASVGGLDRAGKTAFSRLISDTERYQQTMERLDKQMAVLIRRQDRMASANNLTGVEAAELRLIKADIDMNTALSKLMLAERRWAITVEQSAERAARAHQRTADAAQRSADVQQRLAERATRVAEAHALAEERGRLRILQAQARLAAEEQKVRDRAERNAQQAIRTLERQAAQEARIIERREAAALRAANQADRLAAQTARAAEREAAQAMRAVERQEAAMRRQLATHEREQASLGKSKDGVSGLSNVWKTMGGVVAGIGIANVLGDIGYKAKEAAEFVVKATADQQQALVSYARQLGSVSAAYAEMQTIKQGAVLSSQELPEVLQLDQILLARFKTIEAVEKSSGRTFKKVRTDILDTSAALRLNSTQMSRIAIDLQEIGSGQNVGRALQSLNMITGLTKEELMEQGVEFDKAGTRIVSSYDDAFRAVLTVLEGRYAGMDELQSQTFNGMLSNTADLGRMFASSLGEKGIGAATAYMSKWIATIVGSQGIQDTLVDWGEKIGRITAASFRMFEELGAGAYRAIVALRPVTDLFERWYNTLPAAEDGMAALMERSAQMGKMAADAAENQRRQEEKAAEVQQRLEKQQKDLRRAMEDTRKEAGRNIDTQREASDVIKRSIEDGRYAADQSLQPLKDKIQLLDRIYERQNKSRDLAKLNREIERDRALSKDTFSSEGRAAGIRLIGLEQQRAEVIAGMAHSKEKDRIEDSVKGVERRRDAVIHGKEMEQRTIDDRIKLIEKERDRDIEKYELQQRGIDDQLTAMREQTLWFNRIGDVSSNASRGVGNLTDSLGKVGGAGGTGLSGSLKGVGDLLRDPSGPDTFSLKLKGIEKSLEGTQKTVREVVTGILVMNELYFGTLTLLFEKAVNYIRRAGATAILVTRELMNSLQGIDNNTNPAVKNYRDELSRLEKEDREINVTYDRKYAAAMKGMQTADFRDMQDIWEGRTPESATYRNGSDFGTGASPSTPVPATAPVPGGGSPNFTIINQVDALGNFITTVVQGALGNPANAPLIRRISGVGMQ